jgi:hypothetical protein
MNETESAAVNAKKNKYALLAQQERAQLIPLVFNAYGYWHQLVDDLLASSDDSPVPAFHAFTQNTQLHTTVAHPRGDNTRLRPPADPARAHGNALIDDPRPRCSIAARICLSSRARACQRSSPAIV